MRRIMGVFLFMSVLGFMIGCTKNSGSLIDSGNPSQNDDDSEIVDSTTSDFDAYGFEYEMLSYADPYFEVEITDIFFDVVQRKINFHYEIIDYQSRYEYYFVFGYENKEHRPFHSLGQIRFSPQTDYSLDLIYDENNPEAYVTLEMGCYAAFSPVHMEHEETNSAGFKYRIKAIESRSEIDDYDLYLPTDDSDPYHQAGAKLLAHDTERIITSVKFVLSVVFMNNYFVTEETVEVLPTMFNDNDWLIIDNVHFDNLSPGVRYQITAYISGNDGIYDYENIKLGIAQSEMQIPFTVVTTYHGLYAQINTSTKIDDSIHINIDLVNEGIYQINDETPVLFLNFYHSRYDSQPYYSIALQNGINDLTFSNDDIILNDMIKVEDEAHTMILSQSTIRNN
ncbi:hypothetical protein [Mariniplasma anaerobium]|uniref:Lipoprotein n=1 Tax=Mariniplasma anaerobium TaxID=2735436 RepID=A0A7U9TIC9_9MOLU|nr:hypothetical protein [Mariniplasma anaerobium]BCR36649.1 hypothetical protein MPAN_015420 [Mariniplasma anaerobium]